MSQRTDALLSARDLHFASCHQAAQVVVAMMLGCEVGSIQVGRPPDPAEWRFADAQEGDVETICAAGYAIEIAMGRIAEKAWGHAQNDLLLLRFLHAERTGLDLPHDQVEERFRAGAVHSQALLNHPVGRAAVDRLCGTIADRYLSGETSIGAQELRGLATQLMTP